ncbi:EI24 domain-containing protein [Rhodopila sp.]|uniref:EI24 domain-containing protein n=1 Tax=Rhodopila sp. TaxID=2480087 RepID=UPI003D0E8B39
MRRFGSAHLLLPFSRAVSQFDDPTFRGVVVLSVAWSVVGFVALLAASIGIVHRVLALHGWWAWGADALGSIATSLLALWLFLPVAAAIGTLYFDRIAASVERRFYPWLPPPNGASLLAQAWDGIAVALRVLGLTLVGLVLAIGLPGIGLILGWMVTAYAIGRGLFVAVAMRRMPREAAESLYRQNRGVVLCQGAILALAAYVPLVNLLIPILGVAAMVHVLDIVLTEAAASGR